MESLSSSILPAESPNYCVILIIHNLMILLFTFNVIFRMDL